MHNIEEVGVNLWGEQRTYRLEPRFVAYVPEPGGYVSEPQTHQDALREAIVQGLEVGFLLEETAPAKPDYSAPVPSRLSRRKQR
jgi:hypothetical protein